jgi:hypothetical protein
MSARLPAILLLPALLLPAASKNVASARGENEDLILNVTLYIDGPAVKELIGADLDGHYIVAQIRVEPKYGKEISIDRDDFQLRTAKDGEKTKPYAPGQIAGRGALVITRSGGQEKKSGWNLGGGLGMGGGGIGSGGEGDTGAVTATMEKTQDKDSPLKKLLDEKLLPDKKTDQPVSGLLYFPMEQQKMKDLELTYGGRENRITMRFK